MKKSDIVIVGGGAAGLAAAVFARRAGAEVALVERNGQPGRKLRITGKGRCNVTNDCTAEEVMREVNRNPKFLYSSLYKFPPSDVMAFFEGLGVPLKTERGRRVFPVSDRAHDVADALAREAKSLGVRIYTDRIKTLLFEEDKICGAKGEKDEYLAPAVILATGGVSYTATGSDGDGHRMARELGIEVTPLEASLIPLVTKENCAEMMGLSLKNVTLTLYRGDKSEYSEMGEMLFTHFGVSGPLVLSASAHMDEKNMANYRLSIDLKPALDFETLDRRVTSDLKENGQKALSNSLGALLPKSIIAPVIKRSGIPPATRCCDITKEMRRALVSVLKDFTLTPKAKRPINEAIVTRGGVSVKEINPATLMSKKYGGLFFAGEIMDVDAYTGGYNLQIAFSTGRRAGEAAAEYSNNNRKDDIS